MLSRFRCSPLSVAALALLPAVADAGNEDRIDPSENPSLFWAYVVGVIILVSMAGMISGLTVGLMSIDPLKLTLLTMEGDDRQKQDAKTVSSLLSQHHLLLVTLLLSNAAAMEALPLFLDCLVPSWMAILLSVTLVLIFGEVLPQALCTKRPIAFGSRFAWLVRLLLTACWPIAYPFAKLLDCLLGEHGQQVLFKRTELHALMGLHQGPSPGDAIVAGMGNTDADMRFLHDDEITICQGALSLVHKRVDDVMTPFESVFMLDMESTLDLQLMTSIMAAGHTRIPVYRGGSRHNVMGMLLVTRLIVVDPNERRPLDSLVARRPIVVSPHDRLFSLLNRFQEGRSHLAIVTESVQEVRDAMKHRRDVAEHVRILGVVSIEDIVEELIQEEIEDEQDVLRAHVTALHARHRSAGTRGVLKAARIFKKLLQESRRRRGLSVSQAAPMDNAVVDVVGEDMPLMRADCLSEQS